KKLKYIIVGFLGDTYEKELKAFIQSQPEPEAFICFPFLNAEEIRKMYCAADVGIWIKAAISIQEAMGTGLPVILEDKPSVNHLLKNGVNGWFYKKDTFDKVIENAVSMLQDKKSDREKLANDNAATLSYDTIAQKIIENLNCVDL
ncbi:MAG TPA: glycosyltransferase, partial [Bacteroidia bacterium]|nr:glycosyltransferase [Bacteroidia bacterium]